MEQNIRWIPEWERSTQPMLSRAVLRDVTECVRWLDEESDEFRFRMALVAAVALLRTVGHVLKKVDAEHDDVLAKLVAEAFDLWKRDREGAQIFWEFIDAERNNVLKEYELRFEFAPMITTPEADHAWRVGSYMFCPIADGAFAGQDFRDVLKAAIDWWDKELGKIEAEVKSRSTSQGHQHESLDNV